MKARAKVFHDDKSNEDLPGDAFWFTERLRMWTATGLDIEEGWVEFDDESFSHIKTSIGSSGFAHGSEDVFLFDGPVFNDIMAQQAPAP